MRPQEKTNFQPTYFAGAKVKCIKPMTKGDKDFCRSIGYSFPIVGKTYTVRQNQILKSSGNKAILLDEIRNPDFCSLGEMGFFATYFKALNTSTQPGAIHAPIIWDFPDWMKQLSL